MKDIKKIIKLDYISIVPYFTFKNLIIMIFLYCFYFVVSKNPAIAISMPLIFAIIYSSYPFLVGDEAGLDGLYKIFGIKNRDVVIGRYIFAIILFLFVHNKAAEAPCIGGGFIISGGVGGGGVT